LIDQLRDPVRERHARQGGASAKHSIAQLCEPVRERHARQGGALLKHIIAQLREFCASLKIDAEEGFTPKEGSPFSIVITKIYIPDDCDSGSLAMRVMVPSQRDGFCNRSRRRRFVPPDKIK